MKQVTLRASPNRSGFIETIINPINRSENSVFGFWQGFAVTALIFGTVAIMRFLIGH
jgi:hypothetical protein